MTTVHDTTVTAVTAAASCGMRSCSLPPARRQPGVVTAGTLQARGVNFVVLATGAALILALLNFLPAFALGPVAEGLL